MKKPATKKSARIDAVDFWRFFAAMMILLTHVNMVGNSTHHLEHFVEFFFILAGFFIFRHFQKPTFFRQGIEKKPKTP